MNTTPPNTTIITMQQRLAVLDPVQLDIADDSTRHAGHAGAQHGGHYRLTIVSNRFNGQNTLHRHRSIYTALGDMMHSSIHALAIQALTADEAKLNP